MSWFAYQKSPTGKRVPVAREGRDDLHGGLPRGAPLMWHWLKNWSVVVLVALATVVALLLAHVVGAAGRGLWRWLFKTKKRQRRRQKLRRSHV